MYFKDVCILILYLHFVLFEIVSLITQTGLKLTILLPPPLKWWDYGRAPLCPSSLRVVNGA